MSVEAAKPLTVTNQGSRRVILGPPAKSKGGTGKLVCFDTQADKDVPNAKRLGQSHTLTGADAERVRASKTVAAMKDRLGLKVG